MNRSATEPAPRVPTERASGLLGSVLGLGIVVALIALVANVSIGLWTRSTVDSIANDAARQVATGEPFEESGVSAQLVEREAIESAKALMGPYGSKVSLEFVDVVDSRFVALHVRAPGAAVLPRMFARGPVIGAIDRTIVIRREDQG